MEEEHRKRQVSFSDIPAKLQKNFAAQINRGLIQSILQGTGTVEEKYWRIFGDLLYEKHGMVPDFSTAYQYFYAYVQEKAKEIPAEQVYLDVFISFQLAIKIAERKKNRNERAVLAEEAFPSANIDRMRENLSVAQWCAGALTGMMTNLSARSLALLVDWYEKQQDHNMVVRLLDCICRQYQQTADMKNSFSLEQIVWYAAKACSYSATANHKAVLNSAYLQMMSAEGAMSQEESGFYQAAISYLSGYAWQYAVFLEQHQRYRDAVLWYILAGQPQVAHDKACEWAGQLVQQRNLANATKLYFYVGEYNLAYAAVDIGKKKQITQVLPVWQQWHGESIFYTRSLSFCCEHDNDIRFVSECGRPMSASTEAVLFSIFNVLYAFLKAMVSGQRFLPLGVGIVAVAAYFSFRNVRYDWLVWGCELWTWIMISVSIQQRKAWKFWLTDGMGQVLPHPALEAIQELQDDGQNAARTHYNALLIPILCIIGISAAFWKYPHLSMSDISQNIQQIQQVNTQANIQTIMGEQQQASFETMKENSEEAVKVPAKAQATIDADDEVLKEQEKEAIKAFTEYRQAISRSQYSTAWDYMTPGMQRERGNYETWRSKFDYRISISQKDIHIRAHKEDLISLEGHFIVSTSHVNKSDVKNTLHNWLINMRLDNGRWKVDWIVDEYE